MLNFLAGIATGILIMLGAVAWVTRRPARRDPVPFECTCAECRPDLQH